MSEVFDKIYSCITFLGLLPKKLVQALLQVLKKLPILIRKKSVNFIKSTFASRKLLIARLAILVALISVTVTATIILHNNSHMVKAISLTYSGEQIGYASSLEEAELAKANAREYLSSEILREISFEETRTEAHNIANSEVLCDIIVDTLQKDLTQVTEVYVGNTLICAVDDPVGARRVINELLEESAILFPEEAVSFANDITTKSVYYNVDETVSTVAELERLLSDPTTLQIQHAQCLESIAYTEFETVEIQTLELFVGDTRVKRTGQNGSEYQVSLIKTVNGNDVYSEHLMSVPVTTPVTQIVERGIRAENLVMDTYTVVQTLGVFCWPCVDLYEVTSPWGGRELQGSGDYHEGIDISGPNAEGCLVVAGAGGTVIEAGYSSGGYGNYVIIDHGNGIQTVYGHMLDNSLRVYAGQQIGKGEVLGQVGNTGYSFGAHLHFEVRINGIRVNPAPYLGLSQ